MSTAKGKACGKFILLGEHFVVPLDDSALAVPALAFPLRELSCEVTIKPSEHPHYVANLPDESDIDTIESLMARATYAAANALRLDVSGQPLNVESKANFPVSRGFGSSASFAVALVRALDAYRQMIAQEKADFGEMVKATNAVEQIFHGRPSGVDAAVILAEQPIRFHAGAVVREFKNVAADFVVVDSGIRENCAALISNVADFREKNRSQWDVMANTLRGLVDEAERAMAAGQALEVARAVRAGHNILSELGLSNPAIARIIKNAENFGALAGKVSGAGGGGAVLLVANRGDGSRLAAALTDLGRKVVGVVPAEGAEHG